MEPLVRHVLSPTAPLSHRQLWTHSLRKTREPPDSDSIYLHLTQPTPEECLQIWSSTAVSWKDSLTVPVYVAEAQYLTTTPLAKDGGMTIWALVDRRLPPGQRRVICSCESFRKRALTSDETGKVEAGLIHGVASVFCSSEYRGRGYGTRHMMELAKVLRGWQSEYGDSIGSVLYSDIGKKYYTKMGWLPNHNNWHLTFPPMKMEKAAVAKPIPESALESFCTLDEAMVYKAMAAPSTTRKRVAILPSLDHMLWHIRKEDYATAYIFGKKAEVKGAIAGSPGKQVWAIWTRRYYGHPDHADEQKDDNVLYILRLVVEGDDTTTRPHVGNQTPLTEAHKEQAEALKAVIQTAQAEANDWRLDRVELWQPSPLACSLLRQSDLDPKLFDRHEDGIASVLWFKDNGSNTDADPVWVNNEYFAWC